MDENKGLCCEAGTAVNNEKLLHQHLAYLNYISCLLHGQILKLRKVTVNLIGSEPRPVDEPTFPPPTNWSEALRQEIVILEGRIRDVRDIADSLEEVI